MKTTKTPNPIRIYETLARIMERKHEVKITYTIKPKT